MHVMAKMINVASRLFPLMNIKSVSNLSIKMLPVFCWGKNLIRTSLVLKQRLTSDEILKIFGERSCVDEELDWY